MLEFEDIQYILLTRVPALTGRYEFLSFRNACGRARLAVSDCEKVQSAAEMRASVDHGQALGDGGVHLERPARAGCGRSFTGHVS